MDARKKKNITWVAVIGGLCVILILTLGTIWIGRSASRGTEQAVHTVSFLYLDELAGRREQVVASNLNDNIEKIRVAVGLMTAEDVQNEESLHTYQSRMKRLYGLEKFAFVDTEGAVYTANEGRQENGIADYHFEITLKEPMIHAHNLRSTEKKVIIAVPIDPIAFGGHTFTICFIEQDMQAMLQAGLNAHLSKPVEPNNLFETLESLIPES